MVGLEQGARANIVKLDQKKEESKTACRDIRAKELEVSCVVSMLALKVLVLEYI